MQSRESRAGPQPPAPTPLSRMSGGQGRTGSGPTLPKTPFDSASIRARLVGESCSHSDTQAAGGNSRAPSTPRRAINSVNLSRRSHVGRSCPTHRHSLKSSTRHHGPKPASYMHGSARTVSARGAAGVGGGPRRQNTALTTMKTSTGAAKEATRTPCLRNMERARPARDHASASASVAVAGESRYGLVNTL
jgi:hypothetical protein